MHILPSASSCMCTYKPLNSLYRYMPKGTCIFGLFWYVHLPYPTHLVCFIQKLIKLEVFKWCFDERTNIPSFPACITTLFHHPLFVCLKFLFSLSHLLYSLFHTFSSFNYSHQGFPISKAVDFLQLDNFRHKKFDNFSPD